MSTGLRLLNGWLNKDPKRKEFKKRHLQNIASSRERPVTPILDGDCVSKTWYIDVEWYMNVCVTKMTKMTEAFALSVCENVQCQHHPCQPLTFFPISQCKDSQGIQKGCLCASKQIDTSPYFQANRYKSLLPCVNTPATFTEGIHWWTGRLQFSGGERKAEHPSVSSSTSIG